MTPEDTPDFTIDSDGGMTRPVDFTYNGHRVEIVPPDTEHLIGNFWQIKIDGVLRGNYLFSSARCTTGIRHGPTREETSMGDTQTPLRMQPRRRKSWALTVLVESHGSSSEPEAAFTNASITPMGSGAMM